MNPSTPPKNPWSTLDYCLWSRVDSLSCTVAKSIHIYGPLQKRIYTHWIPQQWLVSHWTHRTQRETLLAHIHQIPDWYIEPLHPAHFIRKVPRAPSPSSSDSSHYPQVFPDPDKLEPRNTSPRDQIVADLQQAPIFADIAEPTDQDQKGKSHEGYLPLNPSPTIIHKPFLARLPFPTVSYTTKTMASSSYLHCCNSFTAGVGIPQVNPNVSFSQFANASSFIPPVIPSGFQSHPNPPASVLTPTDGSLKGSGPTIFDGDKPKAGSSWETFKSGGCKMITTLHSRHCITALRFS